MTCRYLKIKTKLIRFHSFFGGNMKFCLNDFLELNTNELLTVNGGYYCNGSSPSTTITPNTYYPTGGGDSGGGGGGSSDVKVGGGVCSRAGNNKDPSKPNKYNLAKVADGIAYPVGDEYSDDFRVTGIFGPREPIETENGKTKDFHSGIDIAAPKGTRINSIGDGIVTEVGSNNSLGNYVVVQHPNGSHTRYAHCEGVTTTVGSRVSAGEQIATVGSTGMSTGPHVHVSYDGNGDNDYSSPAYDNPNNLLSR
jgi:murein DD-endopeptidase MepM/ murein hydrolase activator NlpD